MEMQAVKSRKATIIDNLMAIIALEKLVSDISLGGATNEDVRIINEKITSINVILKSNDVNLDSFQEIVDYSKGIKSQLDKLGIKDIAGLEAAIGQKETKVFVDNMKTKFDTEIADINATLESDDENLQSFQEIVTFIKANRTLLESLTAANIEGLSEALETKEAKVHKHNTDGVTYKEGNATATIESVETSIAKVKTTGDIKHGEGTLAEKITDMEAKTTAIGTDVKTKVDKSLEDMKGNKKVEISSAKSEANTYADEEFATVNSSAKSDADTKVSGLKTVKEAEIVQSEGKMKDYTAAKVPVMEQNVKTDADNKTSKRATDNATETVRVNKELAEDSTARGKMLGSSDVPVYDHEKHKKGDVVLVDGEIVLVM